MAFDERTADELRAQGLMSGPRNWGMRPGQLHDAIYGDRATVRAARVQAQGRIGWRNIKATLLAPFEVVVEWLARRL